MAAITEATARCRMTTALAEVPCEIEDQDDQQDDDEDGDQGRVSAPELLELGRLLLSLGLVLALVWRCLTRRLGLHR